jgi:glycosyltransferase involved in cell wall biosynthesis
MRICIVGGIFGKSDEYRKTVPWAPESVLAAGLEARGHSVATVGHGGSVRYSDFDVVHVHHLARGAIEAALDRSMAPLVFTPHSRAPIGIRRAALHFVVNRSDALVALAAALVPPQNRRTGEGDTIRAVIPNGIPVEGWKLRACRPPHPGEPWRLLYAGQLIPVKRVDLLIHALADLVPSHDVVLELAYQNDTCEGSLRRVAAEAGVAGRTTFMGALPQAILAEAYRRAHVVVLPSASEFLPSVLTEAMLCGTPVIGTDVGAVREQVGQFGIVVPPGSAAALADAIARMIRDYGKFSALSEAMSMSARARYSVEAMLDAHEDLYSRVTRRARPPIRHRGNRMLGTGVRTALRVWDSARSVTGSRRFSGAAR